MATHTRRLGTAAPADDGHLGTFTEPADTLQTSPADTERHPPTNQDPAANQVHTQETDYPISSQRPWLPLAMLLVALLVLIALIYGLSTP